MLRARQNQQQVMNGVDRKTLKTHRQPTGNLSFSRHSSLASSCPRTSGIGLPAFCMRQNIESLQKRALRIIHGGQVFGMPYDSLLFLSNIEPLHQRRETEGKSSFESVCQETSCLNHFPPGLAKRDPHFILKDASPYLLGYPIPYNRSRRYESFINYALSHHQAH